MSDRTGKRVSDRVSGAVELGPRSMALLRRILLALELVYGKEIPDPGIDYEFEEEA